MKYTRPFVLARAFALIGLGLTCLIGSVPLAASALTCPAQTVSCPDGSAQVCDSGTGQLQPCGATSSGSSGASGGSTAGTNAAGSAITLVNPLGAGTTIITVIRRVVEAWLSIVGAFALGIFIYGGVQYMTAGGDSKRVGAATDTLKYAAIGLVIITFAYAISNTFIFFLVGGK